MFECRRFLLQSKIKNENNEKNIKINSYNQKNGLLRIFTEEIILFIEQLTSSKTSEEKATSQTSKTNTTFIENMQTEICIAYILFPIYYFKIDISSEFSPIDYCTYILLKKAISKHKP